MDYESLLEEAYENVTAVELCERFEVLGVKGHHEGVRTVITNFLQVAACIRRPAAHLMKFLSKELASSAEVSRDRLILSRKLSSKVVNKKIEKYVNLFVLCSNCKKPDTELNESGGKMYLRCLACGNKVEVHKI
ncbi:MAG: translation initiation factor IF-2 subunit beta [Nanoarchaeota archaeon]|nr:translation initiation factor IF-2 subunit beta [Nanoarchaeota archaeon]